jgi:hypothetical protein
MSTKVHHPTTLAEMTLDLMEATKCRATTLGAIELFSKLAETSPESVSAIQATRNGAVHIETTNDKLSRLLTLSFPCRRPYVAAFIASDPDGFRASGLVGSLQAVCDLGLWLDGGKFPADGIVRSPYTPACDE